MSVSRTMRRPSKVFLRYALSYLLLLMVVFSVLTAYLTGYVNHQVSDTLQTTQVNRLNRIAQQHNEYIDSMMHTAEQIGLSPYILPFSYEKEPWKAYDLQLQLMPYMATNSICDQIYVHFAGDDYLYSSSASMTTSLFTELMQYEHTDPDTLLGLIERVDHLTALPSQHVTSTLMDASGQKVVTFILPLGASPKSNRGTILFLIKQEKYRTMFQDAIDTDLNTMIFFEDTLLAGSSDLPVSDEAVRRCVAEGKTEMTEDGTAYHVLFTEPKEWNMRYVTVLRKSDLENAVHGAETRVILILSAVGLVSICLAIFLATRHVRPIREISSLLPNTGDSGTRDELQEISSGIQALAKSNTELTSRLSNALPMQRHAFVIRFIKGRFETREEAVHLAQQIGFDIDRKYYAILLAGIQEGEDAAEITPVQDATVLMSELVAVRANLYLVFSDRSEAPRELADALCAGLSDSGGHYAVALSGIQTDYARASAAYLEAATAYDNRFITGDGVLAYEEISHNMEEVLPKAQKLIAAISQAVVLGSSELLEARMAELVSFLKTTSMSPFAFRMIYNDVIDTLIREHAMELSTMQDAREMYNIFSLTSCQSIDDLNDLLRGLCQSILQSGRGKKQETQTEEDVISQVAAYMDAHFQDPEISMSAIAESFDLSTTRLSTAFKERMHMSPLDYLSLLRAEAAKKLLRETDMPVREIGVRVGYYDPGSFARRFKQITGLTPVQYRKGQEAGEGAEN